MSSGTIPLLAATTLAAKLVAQLAPYCERIEVAGSVRRYKAIVGDIELVAIPKVKYENHRIRAVGCTGTVEVFP